MSTKICSHRGCYRPAPHGLGWGLSTGTVQWFCAGHFPSALARLEGLLRAVHTAARGGRRPETKAA
jgi:hypothetical protein